MIRFSLMNVCYDVMYLDTMQMTVEWKKKNLKLLDDPI